MKRVKTYHSPEIEVRGSQRAGSLVEVRLKNGSSLSREAETPAAPQSGP